MGGDLGERNHPDNRKSPYMTFNLDNYEPVAPRLARWLEAAEILESSQRFTLTPPANGAYSKPNSMQAKPCYRLAMQKSITPTVASTPRATWRTVRPPPSDAH
jgi:hypothetical protein